jgi:glycosyltransferase involved in cell wall biosynthesis
VKSTDPILYIGAYLPRLSETFVYREVLELKRTGWTVHTASLHQPDTFGDNEKELQQLAGNTVVIYGGWPQLIGDALAECAAHPLRALKTLLRAATDGCFERDLTLKSRMVLPGQALAAIALAKRVRSKGVRHIHAHMAHAPTTVAMYTAFQLNIPFSFTGHAADLFRDRALLNCKLKRSAFTACISEWHRDFYQGECKRLEAAYPIVRCGVNLDEFSPEHRTTEPKSPLVFGAGRLVPKKGFDVLLRALKRLGTEDVPYGCRIAGGGDEMEPLLALANELELKDSVEFCGAKPNGEINAMMKQSDLFVLPCVVAASGDRDGIPVVLMEAMACEVCVVSGDLPTIRELVKDGETGFMVQPGNADALAETLKKLLNDPALRKRVAQQGRKWVAEEFSLNNNAERLATAFTTNQTAHGGSRDE